MTGGRTQETLSLTKKNFDFKGSKHSIIVKDMRLDKKYKRLEKGVTEKVWTTRDSFPILHREPLTERYIKAVNSLKRTKLFPSMTRQLSYYYVTKAGRKAGVRVSDHWFRGQRASQLQEEYLFKKDECETYFGWRKPSNDMYARYGSTTWRFLETMMARGMKERLDLEEFLSK